MTENAEGPPTLTPALLREAAAGILMGRDRAEVAASLGIDLAALRRHLGPLTVEGPKSAA